MRKQKYGMSFIDDILCAFYVFLSLKETGVMIEGKTPVLFL